MVDAVTCVEQCAQCFNQTVTMIESAQSASQLVTVLLPILVAVMGVLGVLSSALLKLPVVQELLHLNNTQKAATLAAIHDNTKQICAQQLKQRAEAVLLNEVSK